MITQEQKDLRDKILRGEIDINNTELFLKGFYKGFLYDINNHIKVRGCQIPHIVLNTGDDTMFLDVKGQDHSIEPLEVSNEDYVYNQIPRALVQFNGLTLQPDQLTAPYSRGSFSFEYDDLIYGITSEFRRMPLLANIAVKYIFDNFTDVLECSQQLITNLAFIKDFTFTYLGQTIFCTYKISESVNTELHLEFDGLSTDSKNRIINLDIEAETNIPVFNNKSVIFEDSYITSTKAIRHERNIVPRTDEEIQKLINEK